MNALTSEDLNHFLLKQGYTDLREVNGVLCGIQRLAFTYGLIVGLDWDGYSHRYCYEHKADALAALNSWNGQGHPSGPWIKLKGIGVDMLNPDITS